MGSLVDVGSLVGSSVVGSSVVSSVVSSDVVEGVSVTVVVDSGSVATVKVTVRPCLILPAPGFCPSTVPGSSLEVSDSTLTSRPSAKISLRTSSIC